MSRDPAQPPPGRELVFISYSHRNPEWRDRLLILLKPFVRQGRLQVWADPYIEAGSLWRRDIDTALARSAVGVILLTPDLPFIGEFDRSSGSSRPDHKPWQ